MVATSQAKFGKVIDGRKPGSHEGQENYRTELIHILHSLHNIYKTSIS